MPTRERTSGSGRDRSMGVRSSQTSVKGLPSSSIAHRELIEVEIDSGRRTDFETLIDRSRRSRDRHDGLEYRAASGFVGLGRTPQFARARRRASSCRTSTTRFAASSGIFQLAVTRFVVERSEHRVIPQSGELQGGEHQHGVALFDAHAGQQTRAPVRRSRDRADEGTVKGQSS